MLNVRRFARHVLDKMHLELRRERSYRMQREKYRNHGGSSSNTVAETLQRISAQMNNALPLRGVRQHEFWSLVVKLGIEDNRRLLLIAEKEQHLRDLLQIDKRSDKAVLLWEISCKATSFFVMESNVFILMQEYNSQLVVAFTSVPDTQSSDALYDISLP